GEVTFKEGPGGQAVVEVSNEFANATIVLQGAQLIAWAPHSEQQVIWLSPDAKFAPGKSIRGGVPVCWPWFGPHETSKAFPAHGYARTVPWDVMAVDSKDGVTRIDFRIVQDDKAKTMWPHDCTLNIVYHIGKELNIELITRNTGKQSFVIGQALHTYFEVGDVSRISIEGLDGCPYLDKVDDFKRKQQQGAINIHQEVDRIYLESGDDCVINDPVMQRSIRIAKQGSHSTVVWNPWIEKANQMGDLGPDGYLKMVCVESANAAEDVVTVDAGEEHSLNVTYSVEVL
ncbi:MAG: D-hexose-6-phosphate mutarotase, partial [Gammaproteobacteria bacterium]